MCPLNIYRHLSLFYIGWMLFPPNRFGGNFCPIYICMYILVINKKLIICVLQLHEIYLISRVYS